MPRTSLAALAATVLAGSLAAQIPGFPTYADMVTQMTNAANNNPSICQLVNISQVYGPGSTQGNNDIYAVKISDNVATSEDEPRFLIVSSHHSNEYGTPIVALHAIDQFLNNYGSDPRITALVNEYEIWIAPCWNPDGYPTSRNNNSGVDLNRNYPYSWASPCNSGLRGPSAASEIETQSMLAFSEAERFTKVLDYHSSGREVLYGYDQACGNHVFASWMLAEATALSTASGYGGQTRGPSSDGEHYEHQIGHYSNYAFLTEISNTQSPSRASADAEAAQVWPGTLWMLERAIPVWGRVTDSVTGLPLEAQITYPSAPFTKGEQNRSDPSNGRYHAFLPAGPHSIRFELPGYQPVQINVNVTANTSQQFDVQMTPPGLSFSYPTGLPTSVDPAGGTKIRVDVAAANQTPVTNSGRVIVQSQNGTQMLAMTELAPNSYEAELPGFTCDDDVTITFEADDTNAATWQTIPIVVPTATMVSVTSSNPFEVASGWTGGQPGDTAIRGQWNRMDPQPTAAQPGDDHTPAGTQCWVTNGFAGTSIGANDIDGGFTTLISPALDFSSSPDAYVSYWRWFSNNQNGQRDDDFRVDISGNNGATWVNAETVAANSNEATGGWYQHAFKVSDFVTPSAQVRIRFVAKDDAPGSIVEAAIDDFEIFTVDCDGEVARGGSGCPDSTNATLRVQQTGSTHLGSTFEIAVESGVMLPSFLNAGFGDSNWQGQNLPAPIPGTGIPGCNISIEADISLGLLPFGGALPTTVPNAGSFVGLSLFWQGVIFDPALATPTTLASSDNLRTTIGS
ncbi:MAG: M14 family zinc carboxypeptidase [bacterium]|nr:M14 family zinc carboxypeptidase [bacterium]